LREDPPATSPHEALRGACAHTTLCIIRKAYYRNERHPPPLVIASEARRSSGAAPAWIASSLRFSQ
jgi:hypothetical protein